MTWKRRIDPGGGLCSVIFGAWTWPTSQRAEGAVDILASPVQAGCYLAKRDRCKIHVEPFTINLAGGQKLVFFQLVDDLGRHRDPASDLRLSSGPLKPGSVKRQHFHSFAGSPRIMLSPAAIHIRSACRGRDTGDANAYNLGLTGQFTCPTATYIINLPLIKK